MPEFLKVEREGNVAIVTLNRAEKRNALSHAVREEIIQCMASLAGDAGVAVVVLLSAGPVYCAGFDLTEFGANEAAFIARFNESSSKYHEAMVEFTKPIITGIQGPAMGGGFDLAVMCDLRIGTPQSRFAHPEIKLGVPVLFGPLREIVGGGIARELALTGRVVNADEALAIGLLSRIVDAERLREECLATARTIAEAPPRGLLGVKRQIIASYRGREVLGTGEAFLFPSAGS